MNCFFETLACGGKNTAIPEEANFYGKLIGNWKVRYIDNETRREVEGEWHFSWVLEGMAVQDVIVLPSRAARNEEPAQSEVIEEYGTTLRVYNPATRSWDIAYCYTGKIMLLEGRKQDGIIVQTFIDDERRKWVFAKIEDDSFHWQNVTVNDDGEWHVHVDIYAERM